MITHGGDWRGNNLRFATREEAQGNADNLMRRWAAVRATRVVETDDPVNLRWSNRRLAEPDVTPPQAAGQDTAIIIASGRSVRNVCLPLLQVCGAKTVSVNGAVRYAPFSDYAFTLDTSDLRRRWRLPRYAGQRIAAVPPEYRRQSSRPRRNRRLRQPIEYLDRVPFSSNDPGDSIMTGCSGFGAFQYAYKFLAAKRIFLFGCDHDDQGTYFYGDNSNERHRKNWQSALNYWNRHPLPCDIESWNVSPDSLIESIPKIDWSFAFRMLGLPPVPVVTVLKCGGEFNEGHVEWLQRQIGFPIVCLTDSPRPMTKVVSVPLTHKWPGWWSKMEMFRDDLCLGNFLYVDLDTVLLDGVPPVFRDFNETHVLSDLNGQPWIQSCLMFIHHGSRPAIWKSFSANPAKAMRQAGAGGDQIFINRFLGSAKRLDEALPGEIISYKADVLRYRFRELDSDDLETVKVVCFHGQPRPWNVDEPWVPKLQ